MAFIDLSGQRYGRWATRKEQANNRRTRKKEIIMGYIDDTYTYHTDAGHGWIEVPKRFCEILDITKKVSAFSYYDSKKEVIYLEEDCDASLFHKAFEAKFGKEPKITKKHSDQSSFIRNIQRTM